MKKSSKAGQDQKTLILVFAKFLIAIAKVLFWKKRLSTRLCLHPI